MQVARAMPAAAKAAAQPSGALSAGLLPSCNGMVPRQAAAAPAVTSAATRRAARAAAWGKDVGAESGGVVGGRAGFDKKGTRGGNMDVVDARQQIDIERLISACHELQDK